MKPSRAVLTVEILLTLYGAALTMAAPATYAADFAEPLAGVSLGLVRWLGVTYLVIALTMAMFLRRGTREMVPVVFIPVLIGDVAHMAVQAHMWMEGAAIGFESVAGVVLTIVFGTNRLLILQRPERALRAPD